MRCQLQLNWPGSRRPDMISLRLPTVAPSSILLGRSEGNLFRIRSINQPNLPRLHGKSRGMVAPRVTAAHEEVRASPTPRSILDRLRLNLSHVAIVHRYARLFVSQLIICQLRDCPLGSVPIFHFVSGGTTLRPPPTDFRVFHIPSNLIMLGIFTRVI